MDKTRQAAQQFFIDFWHRLNAEWLPALTSFLLFLGQRLQNNPVVTLGLSGLILLLGCLIVRKATEEGWNGGRIFWTIVLFVLGLAGMGVVIHSI
jgi:hypothetical protein